MRVTDIVVVMMFLGGLTAAHSQAQSSSVQSQQTQRAQPVVQSRYTWNDVAKWPDFTTGDWSSPDTVNVPGLGGMGAKSPSWTASVRAQAEAERKTWPGGVWASCEPAGMPGDTGSKFFFSKDLIIISGHSDWYNPWRRVYMDGRGHPADVEPTYFGHSIGHWEGNTLVIDTVGIRAEARPSGHIQVGNDQSHVVERYRLLDADTLELQLRFENPESLTEPFNMTKTMKRHRNYDFHETYCWTDREEGEVDLDH